MVLDELAVCLGERAEWLFRVREGSLEGVGLAFEADGNARDRQCGTFSHRALAFDRQSRRGMGFCAKWQHDGVAGADIGRTHNPRRLIAFFNARPWGRAALVVSAEVAVSVGVATALVALLQSSDWLCTSKA